MTQFSYRQLLENQVFPLMKQQLGLTKFRRTVWQQDGAKPHQARMVMEWLDGIFKNRMLALKSLRVIPGLPPPLIAILATSSSGVI